MSEIDETIAPHLRIGATPSLITSMKEMTNEEARNIDPPLGPEEMILDRDIRNSRLDICIDCDKLLQPMKMCSECGCNMIGKTWMKPSTCPLNKW